MPDLAECIAYRHCMSTKTDEEKCWGEAMLNSRGPGDLRDKIYDACLSRVRPGGAR